jgi:hypothetical protein
MWVLSDECKNVLKDQNKIDENLRLFEIVNGDNVAVAAAKSGQTPETAYAVPGFSQIVSLDPALLEQRPHPGDPAFEFDLLYLGKRNCT